MRKPFQGFQTVPIDRFYLERPVDAWYADGLRRAARDASTPGVHLHGSRQSGKSSLLLRTQRLLQPEHVVGIVDLSGPFGSSAMKPGALAEDEFWRRIAQAITSSLYSQREQVTELGGALDRFRSDTTSTGFYEATVSLVRALDLPLVLLFDEFDRLSDEARAAFCRVFRALAQRRTQEPELTFAFSLVGVAPPVWTDDSPFAHEGHERVPGELRWLDDFAIADDNAGRLVEAFADFAEPAITLPLAAARTVLSYAGGYPQAVSWVGNVVAQAAWRNEVRFDGSFAQRLRELTGPYFSDAALTPDERLQHDGEIAWLRTLEHYFIESTDEIGISGAALQIYRRILQEHRSPPVTPISYAPSEAGHQVLRFSGLARRDPDGGLRLRSQLFADALGDAWIVKMGDRIYRQELAGYVRRPRRPGTAKYASDKRLLIIGTGGTIGMSETAEGVRPGTPVAEWVVLAEELFGRRPQLEVLFNRDSADVGPKDWTSLTRRILQAQGENYDGVVVAHGTDTLAYTASAVAFALGRDLSFPVVFTGSQTTSEVLHGDATSNILRAALVATQDLPEVVVCFGEKIFRATRTQKKDDLRFDAFESPGYPEIGFVAEEVQIFRQSLLPKPTGAGPLSGRPTAFSSGILHISQMPGSEAAFYEAALDARDPVDPTRPLCRGIIISSLGAGNIPTVREAFSLTNLISAATDRAIPVVLTSQYPVLPANYLRYSPSAAAVQAGAIPTGNMTISAVVAKLSWVIPQVDDAIASGMLPADQRLRRVEAMMRDEYVGEGGLTVFNPADESEAKGR